MQQQSSSSYLNSPNARTSKERKRNAEKQPGIDLAKPVFVHREAKDVEKKSVKREEGLLMKGVDVDIPSIENMDTGILHKGLVNNYKREFHFEQLLPFQKITIPILLAGRNVIVRSPSRAGITAAFLLPAMQKVIECRESAGKRNRSPLVLILSDTDELAMQTYENACRMTGYDPETNKSNLGITVFYGDQAGRNVWQDILSVTIDDVLSLVKERKLDLSKLKMLILNKADKIIDGFGKDVLKIYDEIPEKTRQTLCVGMFSATYDPEDDQKYLNSVQQRLLRETTIYHDNLSNSTVIDVLHNKRGIDQRIIGHGNEYNSKFGGIFLAKILTLLGLIDADREIFQKEDGGFEKSKSIVIYVERKITCNYLAAYLNLKGMSFQICHDDMEPVDIQKNVRLMAEGKIQGLVATIKLTEINDGDIPGIDHVIIFELGTNVNEYEQKIRTGRTGMMQHRAKSTVLFNKCTDVKHMATIYKCFRSNGQKMPRWMYNLHHGITETKKETETTSKKEEL